MASPALWGCCWLLFVTLQLLLPAEAKLQSQVLRIGGPKKDSGWKYLTKFGCDLGISTYEMSVFLISPSRLGRDATLIAEFFLDEDWPTADALPACERGRHARKSAELNFNAEGNWSSAIGGTFTQKVRPHIWYFALHDCSNTLYNFTHRFRVEVHVIQESGSEFGTELRGMLPLNVLGLFANTLFVVYTVRSAVTLSKKDSMHPVIWAQAVVLAMQYVTQASHTIHLCAYCRNGVGIPPLEVAAEILAILGQVVQAGILILIALGYTLLQSRLGELDLVIPVCFFIAVIHIVLVAFSKIRDDSAFKYHENEGIAGWLLLLLRLALYLWFLWAIRSTAAEGGDRLHHVCMHFMIAGTLYFFAYPMTFCITQLFAPYWQHFVMVFGLLCMQLMSNLWLGSLFLQQQSTYYKVSTLSDSMLPGGTKVAFVKDE